METKDRVLLVEDEAAYVTALTSGLSRENFSVDVARNGNDAIARFKENTPDIVLLDLMLPGISGFDVCRTIRAVSDVPIIIVSARSDETDAVVGLELGADDYVIKPYRMRELVARMRTQLRRSRRTPKADEGSKDVITLGAVSMDVDGHTVTVDGTEVELTVREFNLLEALMADSNRVISRSELLDAAWDNAMPSDTKTIDVHIMRLRSKLSAADEGTDFIKTVRGVGYRFEAKR